MTSLLSGRAGGLAPAQNRYFLVLKYFQAKAQRLAQQQAAILAQAEDQGGNRRPAQPQVVDGDGQQAVARRAAGTSSQAQASALP